MKKSGNRLVIGFIIFSVLFCLTLTLLAFVSQRIKKQTQDILPSDEDIENSLLTVIIDAGHGGEDGGAVGKNGIYEKELNLSISEYIADMLRSSGINVIMTRTDDILLYDRNVDYKGKKKMLDLAARKKIADVTDNCIFVSIHMNSFPDERYSGLQVYYSGNNARSQELALSVKESVNKFLQTDNKREIKKASDNIYLLDRIKAPAILVECGFISNYKECELLCSQEYQKKLAICVYNGILKYISEEYT